MNQETRQCQNCKQDFTIEPDDFDFYEKIKVPAPTWCPQCRMIRRMVWRNERKLFRRKDSRSDKDLFSLYPEESGWPVYQDSDWWDSNLWDPLAYGQDFDPQKPFFLQLFELCKKVPKPRADAVNMVNSEYSANAADMKNCYLVFNSAYDEDCGYGVGFTSSKNCYDCSYADNSEYCYGSFWIASCNRAYFCSQCVQCLEVWFCKDCLGCTNCFGCMNLRNKKYCIFNQQYSKEEYQQKIEDLKLCSWKGIMGAQNSSHEFWKNNPNKYHQGIKNLDCTGSYVANSKNVKKSYIIRGAQDVAYVQYGQYPPLNDCMDVTVTGETELVYESLTSGWGGSRIKFCVESWNGGKDLEYCLFCVSSSSDLFGCVGVSKQQYCILNKQYTKEEYFALRDKIIKHMNDMPYVDKQGRVYKYGEFYPLEFAPFAYQQTILPEHFNFTRAEVEALGVKWQEPNPTEYQTTMSATSIPDGIEDVKDDILKEIIRCEECGKAYRIIQPELQFLRKIKVPIPRKCVDCRHYERLAQRLPIKLYRRKCMKPGCTNEFETSFAPDRPEIVYCEQCYQAEVA